MSVEVRVPALGESVTEATVATWFKKPGDLVAADEMLCELETDKVTVEVPAPAAGRLAEIAAPEGATVGVAALLATIAEGGEAAVDPAPAPASAPAAEAPKAVAVMVPALGESVTEATVSAWRAAPGARVAQDEILCELETDKVSVEVPAPAAGVLSEVLVPAGATVQAGGRLATILAGPGAGPGPAADRASGPAAAAAAAPAASPEAAALAPAGRPRAPEDAPSARKMMAEAGLARDQLAGSGRDGRVMKEDVQAALRGPAPASGAASAPDAAPLPPVASAAAPAAAPSPAPLPRAPVLAEDAAREERVRMTRLRQTIARRLKEAQNTAAMLTTYNEVDMSAVMELRSEYKDAFEKKHGVRMGFMSFFVKACCLALKEVPEVNAEIDGADIVYKNYVHMGVAVGTPAGLVVPVIRDADQLSFAAIEKRIAELGARARDGKLAMAEMQGGSFTISNGGVYGSLLSAPILNPPQSGILGMHKIQDRPVVVKGQIVIRPMMYLALSYDHRIVDGKGAVTFLVRVKEALEDPRRLLLDL